MARTHRSVERKEKSDLEYYKGLIRQLKKKISSLEKENARLNKILRQEAERISDPFEEDDINTDSVESYKPPKWKCKNCKHDECSEMVLPQGADIIKVYLICNNCGQKDKKQTKA